MVLIMKVKLNKNKGMEQGYYSWVMVENWLKVIGLIIVLMVNVYGIIMRMINNRVKVNNIVSKKVDNKDYKGLRRVMRILVN